MNFFTSLCKSTGLVTAIILTLGLTSTAAFYPFEQKIKAKAYASPTFIAPKVTVVSNYVPLGLDDIPANNSCGCQDQVNVQMNDDCSFTLTIAQVGAGDCSVAERIIVNDANPNNDGVIDCPGQYRYGIFDEENQLICWGEVLAEDKRGPTVKDLDKPYETIPCTFISDFVNNEESTNPNSPYYLGRILFEDNCGDCGCNVETKFFDQVSISNDCGQSNVSFGDEYVYGTISRKFTATDCQGNQTDTTIIYQFVRPDLDDLVLLGEITEQTCDVGDVSPPDVYPYWEVDFPTSDGDYRLGINEINCGYAFSVDENTFDVCGGRGQKIVRYINVMDWCAETSGYVDTIVIKIGDFEAPVFQGNGKAFGSGLQTDGNANSNIEEDEVIVDLDSLRRLKDMGMVTTLSTRPQDCTAAFPIDFGALRSLFGFDIEDCTLQTPSISIMTYGPKLVSGIPTGETIWREGNYPMTNGFAANIPVGIHALVIEIADACYNASRGVVFFQVKDQVAPSMQCDDQLNVTLSTGGYARVFASDVDEGSRDNCALASLQVRRAVSLACIDAGNFNLGDLIEENGTYYTAYNDFVEFFCCDAGDVVVIEMQGADGATDPIMGMPMPNTNTCWLDLLIEDKLDPRCTDLSSVTTTCDDPSLQNLDDLSGFGVPEEPVSNCQSFGILELAPIVELNQCSVGTIKRQWVATGNGGQSEICEQTISVVESYDYWVKFPADVYASCGEEPAAGNVAFVEGACDLIAVSKEDQTFEATQDPTACYKIFRTYKVINWCEYDGEAQPTIISRDWDGFNGTNPQSPDGDDDPGDEDIYVHVKRNFSDNLPDTVYYDNNDNPYDESVTFGNATYGYWWRVISGSNDPTEEAYYEGNGSVWADDGDQTDSDISGNTQNDDNDYRYGSFGFWQYTQHIVVYDDTDPALSVSGQDTFPSLDGDLCTGDVEYQVFATDICTDDALDVTLSITLDIGNDGSIDTDVSDNLIDDTFTATYPQGQHRLIFVANDGCGNSVTVEKVFDIVDRKAPAPICINGLSIELMPSDVDTTGGFMEVWATDFMASDVYDCTGQGDLGGPFDLPVITKENYFIVRDLIEGVSEFDPDNPQTGAPFNCEDFGQVIPVEVHTVDSEGNHDYCVTYVQVEDNTGICAEAEGAGLVSGSVQTSGRAKVEGVEVELSGTQDMIYMTDFNGFFQFNNLENGYDYSISPKLNQHARNGVTTADMIMIGRHVLGINVFSDPFQYIAADINNDKSISTLDMLQLRALVLSIHQSFPYNTSWTFVDADYEFDDTMNPLLQDYPTVKNINNLQGEIEANFVAIKIGDLNGTANVAETRSQENPLMLFTAEKSLQAGELYTVPFYADNLHEMAGFQLSMEFSNAALIEVIPGLIKEESFGIFPEMDALTASWANIFEPLTQYDDPLFYVVIRPENQAMLSQVLRLTSRYTPSEGYLETTLTPTRIDLMVGDQDVSDGTNVYQNTPNPFQESTTISFRLENEGAVKLTFTDVMGRVIKVIDQEFSTGYHQILLNRADFPTAGIVYYTLHTGHFTKTYKMLIVR